MIVEADRIIESFKGRFGQPHLDLACHAAFPVALTPELLYYLWANFQRDIDGAVLNIPWEAVADVLLSGLCVEAGYEIYEFEPAVRSALLHELTSSSRFGRQRQAELAEFMTAYIRPQLRSNDPYVRDFAETQRWNVLAYTRPDEAAYELASAYARLTQHNPAALIRLESLAESFAEPLSDFAPLLDYAHGMAEWARGNQKSAAIRIGKVMSSARQIEIAGVPLPVPEQIRRRKPTSPITRSDLNEEFLVVPGDQTVGHALAELPTDRMARARTYLVLPVKGERYIIVRWIEIEQIAHAQPDDIRRTSLAALPGMPRPSESIDQLQLGLQAARTLRDEQPGRRLVVRSDQTVVGLLVADPRPLADVPADPFAQAVLPGAEATPAATEAAQPARGADERVINVWIDGLAPDQPLALGQSYEIKFNVAPPRADARLTATGVEHFVDLLPPDRSSDLLQIALVSEDFELYGVDQLNLVVPRMGKSKNTVSFAIEPKQNGPGVIRVLVIAGNQVLQRLTLDLHVGLALTGITMGSAIKMRPAPWFDQAISLMISAEPAGYQIALQGGGVTRAFLNLTEIQIVDLIARVRSDLSDIFYLQDSSGTYLYRNESTTIPPDVHAQSLRKLAQLGYYLYQKIFYAHGNGSDAYAMGDLLRVLSREHRLAIQIVAERFTFPWALLYDRDPLDLNWVDPDGFWGFKHIIEQTSELSGATAASFTPNIVVGGRMELAFVANTTIDIQIARPIVQGQRDAFGTLPNVDVTEYHNTQDLYNLLNGAAAQPHLLYVYTHAISRLPGEQDSGNASKIVLSDGQVTLSDLETSAPVATQGLAHGPLVFTNIVESPELTPYLYNTLLPYLTAKGARGVIGALFSTPALFAAEFAKEFTRRFTPGEQPAGDLLLFMRREYLEQKNNVLGLLYALYGSSEMIVQRSI